MRRRRLRRESKPPISLESVTLLSIDDLPAMYRQNSALYNTVTSQQAPLKLSQLHSSSSSNRNRANSMNASLNSNHSTTNSDNHRKSDQPQHQPQQQQQQQPQQSQQQDQNVITPTQEPTRTSNTATENESVTQAAQANSKPVLNHKALSLIPEDSPRTSFDMDRDASSGLQQDSTDAVSVSPQQPPLRHLTTSPTTAQGSTTTPGHIAVIGPMDDVLQFIARIRHYNFDQGKQIPLSLSFSSSFSCSSSFSVPPSWCVLLFYSLFSLVTPCFFLVPSFSWVHVCGYVWCGMYLRTFVGTLLSLVTFSLFGNLSSSYTDADFLTNF